MNTAKNRSVKIDTDKISKRKRGFWHMMLSLIPALLLAFFFVHTTIQNIGHPQQIQDAIDLDEGNKSRSLDLSLKVMNNKKMRVDVTEPNITSIMNFETIDGDFDLSGLHEKILGLKLKHPEVFRILVDIPEEISARDTSRILDAVKYRADGDPKIVLRTKKKKKIRLNVLFPNVIYKEVIKE